MNQKNVPESFPHFHVSTRIIFGTGVLSSLPSCLHNLGLKHPFLLTDQTVGKGPGFRATVNLLKSAALQFKTWNPAVTDPTEDSVSAAVNAYLDSDCDGIVALGGGSVMDTAKMAGVLAHEGLVMPSSAGLYPKTAAVSGSCPVIAVPTTAGTGSEVTSIAMFSDTSTNRKQALRHPTMTPSIALVDPVLSLTMPAPVALSTGVDALCHALECLTKAGNHPMADAFAFEAIHRIVPCLPAVLEGDRDPALRAGLSVAATMAGCAFENKGLQFHDFAHVISARYHIPHGLACGMVLTAGLSVILPQAQYQLNRLAGVFKVNPDNLATLNTAEKIVTRIREWLRRIGVPTLSESTGLSTADVSDLVTETLAASPKSLDPDFVHALWTTALNEYTN